MGYLQRERRSPRRFLWVAAAALSAGVSGGSASVAAAQAMPEAPSSLLLRSGSSFVPDAPSQRPDASSAPKNPGQQGSATVPEEQEPPCRADRPAGSPPAGSPVPAQNNAGVPCKEENPLQPIVSRHLPPLTAQQKGYLAGRDVIDPFNLITILGYAAVAVGSNAHTAYGPGLPGFGRLTGYSLVEDMQGEFFGTFLIPSLAHEDPRYYRMPGRPFSRRLFNALSHTVVTRHDDGSHMPNYATLLTYPISAELSNLYVPGVAGNAPDTGKRILLGLATDPVGGIVAEFLPDVAKRIHIRVIFVQQILQQVAQGGTGGPVANQ